MDATIVPKYLSNQRGHSLPTGQLLFITPDGINALGISHNIS